MELLPVKKLLEYLIRTVHKLRITNTLVFENKLSF